MKCCPKCGSVLKLKSFNPYPKLILGIIIFTIAIITLVIKISPIVWIGGFIWGISMAFWSFKDWGKIKNLDKFY